MVCDQETDDEVREVAVHCHEVGGVANGLEWQVVCGQAWAIWIHGRTLVKRERSSEGNSASIASPDDHPHGFLVIAISTSSERWHMLTKRVNVRWCCDFDG